MKSVAISVLLIAAALAVVLSAQTASQNPPPAATQKKAQTAKRSAPPQRPPNIYLKAATSDGVVTGHTTDANHMVRITVSKEGGEVKTEPVWSDPSGDFTIPLLLLKPGWIVQAWIVDGTRELAHSASMQVAAAIENANNSPAPDLNANRTRVPGHAATDATSGADTARDARSVPEVQPVEASGQAARISVTKTVAANGAGGAGNNPAPANAQSQVVQVASTNPCEEASNGDQQITLDNDGIKAGVSEIKGTVPDGQGMLSVCVQYSAVEVAVGPGPADDKTKYSSSITTDANNRFDILLKVATKENQPIRLVWIKGDTHIKKDVTVQAPAFSRVILPSVPREGETLIKADTTKPPDGNDKAASPLSLSVFVNQDRVPLLDSKGSEVSSMPVDASGETGLTLKNPVDGGDCVVVVEFDGPSLPQQLDFNQLACDAKNRVAKAVDPTREYSHSYPLLANSVFNWGRVRGYMAAGGLFSFDNASFSQESIFLAFNMTKNWIWGGPFLYYSYNEKAKEPELVHGYKRMMLETFFDTRLTSLPVASCTSSSSSPASGTSGSSMSRQQGASTPSASSNPTPASGDCPNTVDSFISTRKTAVLNGGVSIPFIASTWTYGHRPYALSFGPLAKVGFDTPVGDVQNGTTPAVVQQFYTNFGFGARLGLYRMSFSPEVAPDLESYIDVVTGRYSNFDTGPTDVSLRYARPWRIGIEGVLKIPTTPFILGLGANIHQNFGLFNTKTVDHAKDSLQFLFGARFDAGKLFNKLGSIK